MGVDTIRELKKITSFIKTQAKLATQQVIKTQLPGLDNHKGQQCLLKPIICQEGFCSGCMIYLEISFTLLLEEKDNCFTGVSNRSLKGKAF